jgi:hypothetical protein
MHDDAVANISSLLKKTCKSNRSAKKIYNRMIVVDIAVIEGEKWADARYGMSFNRFHQK